MYNFSFLKTKLEIVCGSPPPSKSPDLVACHKGQEIPIGFGEEKKKEKCSNVHHIPHSWKARGGRPDDERPNRKASNFDLFGLAYKRCLNRGRICRVIHVLLRSKKKIRIYTQHTTST